MKYKLIAMDMDGTLLNTKKNVSERTREVLKKAENSGVKLVICTGRIFTSALSYARIVGTKAPIIASNGAYIREKDRNEIIYSKEMGKKELVKIVDMAKSFEMYPQLFTDDTIFSEKLIHVSSNYSKWNESLPENERIKISIVEDLSKVIEEYDGKILKVVISSEEVVKLGELRQMISEDMDVSIVSSYFNNIEIMNAGISKGSAVKILSEYYGIKPEEVICFGDAENDISMIKYAGLGVAMGNAADYVKQIADYVTDTNDNDGVAKAISKYVLNEESGF